MRFPLKITLAIVIFSAASAGSAQAQMRHQGLDRNNDGIITRDEWRGNDRSFRNQDWNGDGVLSGDELRPGARRQTNWNQDWNRDGIVDNQDSLIAQRFRTYDTNSDGRVAAIEWPGDQRLFRRLDTNRDRFLSMQEYTTGGGFRSDSQGGPAYRFSNLDVNRDGWVTRNEWNLDNASFNRLDANRDNRISRFEFENDPIGPSYTPAQFANTDVNRDGWITRTEWRLGADEFNRLDTNNDNRISRFEFESASDDDVDDDDRRYRSDRDDDDRRYLSDRFTNIDTNRDGSLSRIEFRGGDAMFTRLDTNRDNRLSRAEYDAAVRENDPTPARSAAWRTGYDRGIEEGRRAGREDYVNGHGWDLEGQTELERADSGYNPQVGPLSEYQAGYREGFRNAYREGFLTR
jgi:Ca2+-binding EF-hand superfamily protein